MLRYAGAVALLTGAYVAAGWVSLVATYFGGVGSPIWLPAGLSLASVLLCGVRFWPMVFLGNVLLLTVVTSPGSDWVTAAFIGAGNSLEAVAAWVLMTRVFPVDRSLPRVRDVVRLVSIGALLTPMLSVAGWLAARTAGGTLGAEDVWRDAVFWWSGNMIGCVLGAPLVLGLLGFRRRMITGRRALEAVAFAACIVAVQLVSFADASEGWIHSFPFAFIMFPPMIWAAIRFSVRGVSIACFAFALMTVVGTLRDVGPFVGGARSVSESLIAASIFIFFLSSTSLTLSAAMNERELAARAQLDAERKYHQLVEQASDGIYLTDPGGGFIEANRRALEMLGYSLDELRRRTVADLQVADPAEGQTTGRGALHTGMHLLTERRWRRKDESVIPVEVSEKKLHDGRYLGIVRDITQRKRAEAQRTTMMRELDHRVKNNLAVVLSIADQTARRCDSLGEFSERFIGRIMSLANVHGMLARSHWQGVDVEAIVLRTLQPHVGEDRHRLRTSGPRITLPARGVGPLGMTLHELATNAAKYGSLSTPTGIVEVEWKIGVDTKGQRRLRLRWVESGGPTVGMPAAEGFGTRLIRAGLAHEIGATVELAFDPSGARCDIDIPIREESDAAAPTE
ncbi:MAG: MASE1 domain-containing protein [Phycisphaerales bacterium]